MTSIQFECTITKTWSIHLISKKGKHDCLISSNPHQYEVITSFCMKKKQGVSGKIKDIYNSYSFSLFFSFTFDNPYTLIIMKAKFLSLSLAYAVCLVLLATETQAKGKGHIDVYRVEYLL